MTEDQELDEIQNLAHELVEIRTVNQTCKSLLKKVEDILISQQSRIESYSRKLDLFASQREICINLGCKNRAKYKPNTREYHGEWP